MVSVAATILGENVSAPEAGTPTGYKKSEVGIIPEDWDAPKLREGISLHSGHHVLAQFCNAEGRGVPYLTGPADFPEGKIQQTKFTTKPSTLCAAGDILVTVKGSGAGKLTRADRAYCISRQLMAIQSKKWSLQFIDYAIRNSKTISAAATGLIPGISRDDILDTQIALPRTPREQQAIAEALSDADALIESLEQLIVKKRQIKQGAMQDLLTGKRRLPGFSGEWNAKRLGQVATFHKGKGLPKSSLDPFGDDPCIHYGELFTRYAETIRETFSRTNSSGNGFLSVTNDVLMPTSDVTPNGLAKASCVTLDDVILGGDILVIRADAKRVFGPFLSHMIRHEQEQILQLVTGTTVFHLYAADMRKFEFLMPSVAEQQEIVAVLEDIGAEIAKLEQRLSKARQIKQGMMQELLTGRVRLV